MSALLTALAPLAPLLLSPLLFTRQGSRWIGLVAWSLVPSLGLVLLGTVEEPVALPWLLTGMVLGLDATARVFLLPAAALWLAAAWYGREHLARDPARGRFFGFFALAAGGNIGALLALDVVSFYLFFALMTFSIYGLVVHRRSVATRHAGAVYLALAVVGEAALLVAFVLIVHAGGQPLVLAPAAVAASPWRDAIIGLLLIGFGAKVGVLGFHVSLPLAYEAAPAPGAAVLAGAMIKVAVLGWLRFLPLGEPAPGWAAVFIGLGLAAALYGVFVGILQQRPKVILAYSSVSQMGLVTAGVGFGLASAGAAPLARTALALFALHHALVKGALFLGEGLLRAKRGPARLGVFAGLALLALALSGAPLTSGALAKHWLKELATLTPWGGTLAHWLTGTSIATTVLMVHFLARVAGVHGTVNRRRLVPGWALVVAAAFVLPWLVPPVAENPAAAWNPWTVAGAAWPVLVGAALAMAARELARRAAWRPRVPAGDVLLPAERGLRRGLRLVQGCGARWDRTRAALAAATGSQVLRPLLATVDASATRVEARLRTWSVVGLALLVLLALLLAFLALHPG